MNWPRKVPAFLDIELKSEVVVVTNGKKCRSWEQTAEQWRLLYIHTETIMTFFGLKHSWKDDKDNEEEEEEEEEEAK